MSDFRIPTADNEADHYRLLVGAITDYAIYMLDPDGRVTSWNAGAERFKGYTADEIIGQHFSRFYTAEDRAAGLPQEALSIAAAEGRFEREGWRVRKDGARFWAHVVIDPIRDKGKLVGFAKITRDMTERRQVQRALEEAQQMLFQSQKLDSIGQLTGGVAHDFNNLLTAILGSLELLRKRLPTDPKAQMLLDNAIQGAQRGASLTQRMLAFARRQELKPEPIEVPALVNGMRGLMERSIGPGVRIRTEFPPDLPPATSDANQLEAALLNLVLNARDAMPQGGSIDIGASVHELESGNGLGVLSGCYVRLAVTDTGVGMDEQTRRRAMEPFFTTKGVGKGTGLGLSMAHGLAEQSGGRLRIVSAPGEGATVEIWLRADMGAPRRRTAAPETVLAGSDGPLTILVVDDDALVLVNTAAMLEDLGHRVIATASGAEALDVMAGQPRLDVIVTDQVMPEMTGLELAIQARALCPDTPIVLATGYTEQPTQNEAGLTRLAKPFNQAELAAALREALAAHAAQPTRAGRSRADRETV